MDNDLKSIEKSVAAIYDKADKWEDEGRNAFECWWQVTLEIMLLLVDRYISERPGQLVPMEIENQDEWEFYLNIKKKLDLPPETCAVLVTPSAFKKMPAIEVPGIENFGPKAWERKAYSLIISDLEVRTKIMQAALPGIKSPGIDVFEDGNQLADYTYNTIDECIDDLTKNTWIHFNPEGTWTDELIVRYTENWFSKSMEIDLINAPIHQEFSYVHHPELLGLSPFEAVFRMLGEMMQKEFDDLQNIVNAGNAMNGDLELGYPFMTVNGILSGKENECHTLLENLKIEMENLLGTLENVDGVKFPQENRTGPEYRKLFDETALKIYEGVVGKPYPG
jgi:hypothetical protein